MVAVFYGCVAVSQDVVGAAPLVGEVVLSVGNFELAEFSALLRLKPQRGECYFLDGGCLRFVFSFGWRHGVDVFVGCVSNHQASVTKFYQEFDLFVHV